MRRIAASFALAFSVVLAATAFAGEPVHREIPFSKKVPLYTPRTYTFHFSIYDAATDGTELWYEEKSVSLKTKTLSHNLGSVIAFADADAGPLDFSEQYWIQVSYWYRNAWRVLGTRVKLVAAPYALAGPAGEKGAPGPVGPMGATGAVGAQGPLGPSGPQGIAGPQGDIGPQGLQGIAGPAGPEGSVGPKGDPGATGATGPQGPAGTPGLQGVTGPIGPVGGQGPQGATGAEGASGSQGATGAQGPVGPQGPAGPQGEPGAQGSVGLTGAEGPQGPQGPMGPQGPPGIGGTRQFSTNMKAWDADGHFIGYVATLAPLSIFRPGINKILNHPLLITANLYESNDCSGTPYIFGKGGFLDGFVNPHWNGDNSSFELLEWSVAFDYQGRTLQWDGQPGDIRSFQSSYNFGTSSCDTSALLEYSYGLILIDLPFPYPLKTPLHFEDPSFCGDLVCGPGEDSTNCLTDCP